MCAHAWILFFASRGHVQTALPTLMKLQTYTSTTKIFDYKRTSTIPNTLHLIATRSAPTHFQYPTFSQGACTPRSHRKRRQKVCCEALQPRAPSKHVLVNWASPHSTDHGHANPPNTQEEKKCDAPSATTPILTYSVAPRTDHKT